MFVEIHKNLSSKLPFVLTTLGEIEKQQAIYRPDGFGFHQFIWVKGGSGVFRIGGKEYIIGPDEGMFMRANTPHSYEGKPFHTAWCTFLISDTTLDYLGVGDYLLFSVPSYLNRETQQLIRFANGDSTPASRSAAGYSFVMGLFSTILESKSCLSTKVLRILEQKYSEPLTLTDLSEELRVDKFTLCKVYKSERGITVMEDLNRIRIAKAKRFLSYGSQSIESVGKDCGFDSPSYFGKRFREATGMSPGEYRKMK